MEDRVDTPLLWARAALVGSMVVLIGVVGHVSADGLLPGRFTIAALLALSVGVAGPFLARPASRLRLVLIVVGGQLVVHLGLSISGGHRGEGHLAGGPSAPFAPPGRVSLPTVDGRRVGSLHDAAQVLPDPSRVSVPGMGVGHLVDDLAAHAPMMAAHVAAAAVIGLWLAYGEKTLWSLVALTARRLLVPVPSLPPALSPVSWSARLADLTLVLPHHTLWNASPTAVRGPPVLTAR